MVKYFAEDFRKGLIGKKNEDSILLQLDKAFADKERAWVISDLGLTAETAANKFFNMLITKVGFVEKAVMDETFFKAVYPNKEIATEADLRNAIKEDMTAYWDAQGRSQILDQLYHYLLDHTKIEFPETFLKRWMENGAEQPKTADQVIEEYPSFIGSLKWTLIVDQLVKENNIEVNPTDIRDLAKNQLFSYMGNMGAPLDMDQPWVNDYVEKMMKDKKFVEDSFHRIQTDKVFAVAETKINATDVAVSMEDFVKMQEGHQHHH